MLPSISKEKKPSIGLVTVFNTDFGHTTRPAFTFTPPTPIDYTPASIAAPPPPYIRNFTTLPTIGSDFRKSSYDHTTEKFDDNMWNIKDPLLSSMSQHTEKIKSSLLSYKDTSTSSSPSSSSSSSSRSYASSLPGYDSNTSSRRSSLFDDLESASAIGNWLFTTTQKRKSRRTTLILSIIFLSCGLVYMIIDNFLLADWVSSRSRYTPEWLGPMSGKWIIHGNEEDGIIIPLTQGGEGESVFTLGKLINTSWLGDQSEIFSISNDDSHIIIPHSSSSPKDKTSSINLLSSRPQPVPQNILEQFYISGKLPIKPQIFATKSFDESSYNQPPNKVDLVYTYVNASSPLLRIAREERAKKEGISNMGGMTKHFRDNGELRGAVRSAYKNLGKDNLGKIHFISADFDIPSFKSSSDDDISNNDLSKDTDLEYDEVDEGEDGEVGSWRVGQIPSWLDPNKDDEGLTWHFHSEIFQLPKDNQGQIGDGLTSEWQTEQRWKEMALPTFNSFAIEGRVGWLRGLAENFILSNDDMFFLRELSSFDFHHPYLGPIYRLANDASLRVPPDLPAHHKSDPGEWGGLRHANKLLSDRFYPKNRMYMAHVPKSMTKTIAHEASIMFSSQLSLAATRGFRESQRGEADIHFAWLATHLNIERWREGLLWSFLVGKLSDNNGNWREGVKDEMRDLLGMNSKEKEEDTMRNNGNVVVTKMERQTIFDMEEMMNDNEWDFPRATNFLFTSLDGHLPGDLRLHGPPESCVFNIPLCLPENFLSQTPGSSSRKHDAEYMFKHMTFAHPSCGDCLIIALMNKSGERGLSAILPEEDKYFTPSSSPTGDFKSKSERFIKDGEAVLPLEDTWQTTSFALKDIIKPHHVPSAPAASTISRGVNLRSFCIQLLSRYVYTLAETPTHFALATSPGELSRSLMTFDVNKNLAMGCINDDQPDSADNSAKIIINDWMMKRFGDFEVPWEKKGYSPFYGNDQSDRDGNGNEDDMALIGAIGAVGLKGEGVSKLKGPTRG